MIPNVLSIAGSDPSGGAGIQADLKAFSANGVYGMAAVTALTAQNTTGVTGIHLVPPDFVAAQIDAVFSDIQVAAVKIGMIATAEIAEAVADSLKPHDLPIVFDPVMVAKGGARLLEKSAVDALRRHLLPLATVVTPNLPELADLLAEPPVTHRDDMSAAARRLLAQGPSAVLLKGGHLNGDGESPDCLVTADSLSWFDGPRHDTRNTHGTGCTLSATLAAMLARGLPIETAARAAKDYVSEAIAYADELTVGHGHGPTHHFHAVWK